MDSLRRTIARKIRALRLERRWTQAELASRLGLSQSRLSQVERGDGSFTAEQLVAVLRLFNVPISYFVDLGADDGDAALQNALARLGASHLRESTDVLVPPAHEDLVLVVRDALLSGSPRLITALAPALVANLDRVRLSKIRATLADAGLEARFWWLLDNVRFAVNEILEGRPSRHDARRYGRALVVLSAFLDEPAGPGPRISQPHDRRDVLDADIRSKKSLQEVWTHASEFSKRWGIVTTLQPHDFRLALEQADVAA
jgi:transcriptional regulator with XRE-family HTH domain